MIWLQQREYGAVGPAHLPYLQPAITKTSYSFLGSACRTEYKSGYRITTYDRSPCLDVGSLDWKSPPSRMSRMLGDAEEMTGSGAGQSITVS